MNSSRYKIVFYTELNQDGSFVTNAEGLETVTVGITTKPARFIYHAKLETSKDLFFFFVGTIKNHRKFLQEIEELSLSKDVYQLEPLSDLLRRKCKENSFQPYRLKRYNNQLSTGSQNGVIRFE